MLKFPTISDRIRQKSIDMYHRIMYLECSKNAVLTADNVGSVVYSFPDGSYIELSKTTIEEITD